MWKRKASIIPRDRTIQFGQTKKNWSTSGEANYLILRAQNEQSEQKIRFETQKILSTFSDTLSYSY